MKIMTNQCAMFIAVIITANIIPAAQARCVGDLDGDGVINGADLGLFLSAWGNCNEDCPADLDGNGSVAGRAA